MNDDEGHKHAALRELSDADRAYRAAFSALTSRGGLDTSSFSKLLTSVERLREVVLRLRDTNQGPRAVGD